MPSFLGTVLEVYPFVLIQDSSSKGSECGGKSPRQSVFLWLHWERLSGRGEQKAFHFFPYSGEFGINLVLWLSH